MNIPWKWHEKTMQCREMRISLKCETSIIQCAIQSKSTEECYFSEKGCESGNKVKKKKKSYSAISSMHAHESKHGLLVKNYFVEDELRWKIHPFLSISEKAAILWLAVDWKRHHRCSGDDQSHVLRVWSCDICDFSRQFSTWMESKRLCCYLHEADDEEDSRDAVLCRATSTLSQLHILTTYKKKKGNNNKKKKNTVL